MTRLALALCLAAAPVGADPARHVWPTLSQAYQNSTLELGEPQAPNAVATVVFVNTPVHREHAAETIYLEWNGLAVRVDYERRLGALPDRITVHPPEGYIAVPRVLDVEELTFGRDVQPGISHIYAAGEMM